MTDLIPYPTDDEVIEQAVREAMAKALRDLGPMPMYDESTFKRLEEHLQAQLPLAVGVKVTINPPTAVEKAQRIITFSLKQIVRLPTTLEYKIND